jgi:hypothetical protein
MGSGSSSRCNRKVGSAATSSHQHWPMSPVAFRMRKVQLLLFAITHRELLIPSSKPGRATSPGKGEKQILIGLSGEDIGWRVENEN